jgi:hypothetical protein
MADDAIDIRSAKLMARYSTDAEHAQIVDRYKTFRNISRELQNHALQKYVSKRALEECGEKLGFFRRDTLVFADMDEAAVLMDYCIYDYRQHDANAVARYIADSRLDPSSDEYAVLKAMSESFYTLVQVEDVLPGVGVRVNDLMNDRQYLLTDIEFSTTATKGIILATRILPFNGFVMTSGAALPVGRDALLEILDFASEHFPDQDDEHSVVDAQQGADFAAAAIRISLASDSSGRVEYRDIEDRPATIPLRGGTRIGRNEPCPCGSGRKYKRCCGR